MSDLGVFCITHSAPNMMLLHPVALTVSTDGLKPSPPQSLPYFQVSWKKHVLLNLLLYPATHHHKVTSAHVIKFDRSDSLMVPGGGHTLAALQCGGNSSVQPTFLSPFLKMF